MSGEINRYTCRRCGQTFTGAPLSTESWNKYAAHSYDCKGNGPPGYEHDVISTAPFDPVRASPQWSPYAESPAPRRWRDVPNDPIRAVAERVLANLGRDGLPPHTRLDAEAIARWVIGKTGAVPGTST